MPLKLALFGGGYWGRNLARNFHELGCLHTLCDVNELLLDSYQAAYPGLRLTSNYQSALKDPEISTAAIATPALSHYKLAKEALLAGKDVYVEKPLCLTTREAEELIELAEAEDKILMVGHLLQYHPCVNELQKLVKEGVLGKLCYIASNRLNLGSYRTEENALWNFAPHDVSVILSLCGGRLPEEVCCQGAAYLSEGVADTTLTSLSFAGGVKSHIYVSWLNPFKEQKLTVVGSEGMAVFDDTKPWGSKLTLYRNHVTWAEGRIPLANQPEAEAVDPPQAEPLKSECSHFIRCCLERRRPLTDGEEALNVLKVLEAAQKSLTRGGEKAFPQKPPLEPYFAHPSALIDEGAEIGEETRIWHFSHVMGGAKIGARCTIGQNCLISPQVVLGEGVKVQNNVSLYSGILCEEAVFIGPSAVFTNISHPRSEFSRRSCYEKTLLRKGATVGANATILCGLELGEYSFVAAGAVVTRSVKPYALVAGNPARQIGWRSRSGHRLELPLQAPEGEELSAVCPETKERFLLKGDRLSPASRLGIPLPQ